MGWYTRISELEHIVDEALHNGIEYFIENGGLEYAAEVCETLGDEKSKELWKEVAKLYEEIGEFECAARAYEKAGYLKEAANIWEKVANAIKNKHPDIAAKYYENTARLYEKLGDKEKAKGCYMKAGYSYEIIEQFEKAAEAYEKAGNKEKAKEAWEKEIERLKYEASLTSDPYDYAKIHEKIAEIYKNKLNDFEKAKKEGWIAGRAYMISGSNGKFYHYEDAARVFKKFGYLEYAIETWLLLAIEYIKRNLYVSAAKARRKAEELKKRLEEDK